MKRFTILIVIITVTMGTLSAEVFRLGGIGAMELMENPLNEETIPEFEGEMSLIPGFYWEVIVKNVGFGMTYMADFTPVDPSVEEMEYDWYLDWLGTFDFRYHILGDFFIDPFVELGIGNAGRVELTEGAMEEGMEASEEPLLLSLFAQAGGGAAVRLGGVHLGAKVLYRFYNEPIPAAQIEIYPLKNFQASLFAGFSF